MTTDDAGAVRLHHVPWGRSFRILWLLCEMGLEPDEIVTYQIGDRARRDPAFLAKSPGGRIPALEIDGQTLFESAAISQYLCETRPEHGFGRGPGHPERVRFLEVMGFAETQASLIEQLNLNHVFLRPPAKPSPVVVKLNTARLRATVAAFDGMIEGDYILPSGFSAADVMMGFNLYAVPYFVPMDPWPKLQAYWDRLQARPAFRAAVALEGPRDFYAQDFYPVPDA
jgi:glutathione S-transferase